MKSIFSMNKFNKRGQVLDQVSGVVVGVFVLLVTVMAIFVGMGALNAPSFFTAGSASANATQALQDNTTLIAQNFSQRLPILGTILGVVLLLGALLILIFYAARMRQAGGSASAGGL